jgi:hypothetical protein
MPPPSKRTKIGERYGKLVVVGEERTRSNNGHICWLCRCDCGNEKIVVGSLLRQGKTKDCGCQGYYALRKKNEVGKRYGKLVVIGEMPRKPRYWRCKCDCGKETIVLGQSLRIGATTSCGCYQRKNISRIMTKNELGKRYGKLVVVGESPNRYHGYVCWFCKCDCGNEIEVNGSSLRQGLVKSCGCLRRGRKKI